MIEIREIGAAELGGWIAVAGGIRADRSGSPADYEDWKRQAEDMAWFVATRDGEDAGVALGYVGWHSAPGTGHGEAFVLPEHRGSGVGCELYRELASWLIERGAITFETTVAENDADSLAWADRRGFREVGRNSRMVLDLSDLEPQAIDPPEGMEIVTWAERPELAQGMYEVACEAYRDIPGDEDAPMDSFEEWLSRDMQGAGDRPEATFVALAGDEVVGYGKLSISSAPGTVVAHHDLTGVKRAHRGRGIASALKRAEIAWAKETGYERLETANEVRNEPIRRLNERYGYRVQPGLVVLHESLAGNE